MYEKSKWPASKDIYLLLQITMSNTTPEWEERFDEIQRKMSYTDYGCERFCCGGDYCEGDHLGFIKSFISQELKLAEQRGREEVIEKIKANKFKTYSAKTALMDGNTVLSQVSEVSDLVRMQDLSDFLKSIIL